MLQIHDIIESLPTGESDIVDLLKKSLTEYQSYDKSACFDFGNIEKIPLDTLEQISKYALELLQNKMFVLPYNPVYYSWDTGEDQFGVYVVQKENDSFDTIFFFAEKRPFEFVGTGILDDTVEASEKGAYHNLRGEVMWMSPKKKMISKEGEKELMQYVSTYTIVLTALMQSTHTRTRKNEVSPKQNKSRAKRNLPAIMPFHTVYFEVGGKRYSSDGRELGGTHASPKLHWRRGHVRKLASGKMTHVRPCLVGAMGADVEIQKPTYVLKQKGISR